MQDALCRTLYLYPSVITPWPQRRCSPWPCYFPQCWFISFMEIAKSLPAERETLLSLGDNYRYLELHRMREKRSV